MKILFALCCALILNQTPLSAHAKHRPSPKPEATSKVHRVEPVAEHVYAIFGRGGNIGLVVTAKHAILIDDQYEKLAPELLETVRSVTRNPIKYLINTHFHGDHVGGNVVLAHQVTAIVAHANVRSRIQKEQAAGAPAQLGGLPELALGEPDPKAKARLDIHLDGTEIHLAHFGPGHTDGDLLVGIPSAKVLHMGDIFFQGFLPFIDLEGGGHFEGLLAQVEHVASWLPEDAKIIPGHGPICGKKELLRYRDFLKALLAHAKANPSISPSDLAKSFPSEAWPEWKPMPEFVTWESLFEAVTGKGLGRVKK